MKRFAVSAAALLIALGSFTACGHDEADEFSEPLQSESSEDDITEESEETETEEISEKADEENGQDNEDDSEAAETETEEISEKADEENGQDNENDSEAAEIAAVKQYFSAIAEDDREKVINMSFPSDFINAIPVLDGMDDEAEDYDIFDVVVEMFGSNPVLVSAETIDEMSEGDLSHLGSTYGFFKDLADNAKERGNTDEWNELLLSDEFHFKDRSDYYTVNEAYWVGCLIENEWGQKYVRLCVYDLQDEGWKVDASVEQVIMQDRKTTINYFTNILKFWADDAIGKMSDYEDDLGDKIICSDKGRDINVSDEYREEFFKYLSEEMTDEIPYIDESEYFFVLSDKRIVYAVYWAEKYSDYVGTFPSYMMYYKNGSDTADISEYSYDAVYEHCAAQISS